MKQPEADFRELAKAVDRVHRVDASIDHTWDELRRVSQRQLVTTGVAVGLGVAALATLAGPGKKTRDGRDPGRAASRRPIVRGPFAALVPWMFEVAIRSLSSRPTRSPDSARNRLDTERRDSLQPAIQGDPQ